MDKHALGLVMSHSYDSYPDLDTMTIGTGGLLIQNDIIACCMGSLTMTVEISTNDGNWIVAPFAVKLVAKQRCIVVNHRLETPVELMVTQCYGIVIHLVKRHIHRLTTTDIRQDGTLIDVTTIKQQKLLGIIVCASSTYIVGLISNISQAIVVRTRRGIHQCSMNVSRLHNGQ